MDIFDYIREQLIVEEENIEESLKGFARRIKKKLKDPLRKKAYKRAGDLEDRAQAMTYHARRAGRAGIAKPETVEKARRKYEKHERWAGRLHSKAFDPKQFKGRKKMWMEK